MMRRALVTMVVLYVLAAWCVSGADAQISGAYASDFDSWSSSCPNNNWQSWCVAEDGSTPMAVRNPHAFTSGAACLGGAGNCIAFNPGCDDIGGCPGDSGDQPKWILFDWDSGDPLQQHAPTTGDQTLSIWYYFPSAWQGPSTNRYKIQRWQKSGTEQFVAVVTLLFNGTVGIHDLNDTEVIVSGFDWDDHRDEWILVEGIIRPSDGSGDVTIYDTAGNVLGSGGYTGGATVLGASIIGAYAPENWTPGDPGTWPEENIHYVDSICACSGDNCGVGSGGACDHEFPGAPATTCGDGVREGSEACDDGDTSSGDGCSATCTVESGWSCSGVSPDTCSETCGDGLIVGAEECDDGDTSGGDGCSAACAIEAGWECSGEPSSCSPLPVSPSPVIVGGSISGGRTGQ